MVSDEGEGNACRVSASSCIDFAVSPDTLLIVRDRCRMKERENDRTRQFLSVSDLQEKGDFKSYLAGLPVENGSSIPSWEGIDVFRGDIFIRRNTLRLDDPDFWYIVGVYIKRGYLPSNPRNTDLSSPYYKAVAVIKPEEASVIMAHKPKWMNLGITTGKTGETVATVATVEFSTFMSVFGRLVSDKHIPYVFHSLPTEYLRMIIAVYLLIEGEDVEEELEVYTKRRITSVNSSLILSLAHMVDKGFHTVPKISTTRNNKPRIFDGRVVEMKDYHNLDFFTKEGEGLRMFYDDDAVWYLIKNIQNERTGFSV